MQHINRRESIESDTYPYQKLLPFLKRWIELDATTPAVKFDCNILPGESKISVDCVICSKKKFPIIVEVNHGYIAIHRSGSGQLSQGWEISRSRPGYINYIIWEIERIGGEFLQEVLIGNTLKHNFQR